MKRTAEEHAQIIDHELHVMSPMWLTPLVNSLGVIEPFVTGAATFKTQDDIERAAIRLALMCQAFEEMLGMERGEMLNHLETIYPIVEEKAAPMQIAANMHWHNPVQCA